MEDAGPGVSAVPPGAPPSRGGGLRRPAVAYALIAVLFVAPIYVMAASLAVRAGLFDFSADGALSADDARAAWGFVGAAVAAAVTATGLLLTRSHNLRTLAFQESVEQAKRETERQADQRLSLDTAIASLKLLGEGPQYSTPAAVAGALTTLVQLGHPIIALRCLAAAWPTSSAVDVQTAVWIMEAAFAKGDDFAQHEVLSLAHKNLDALVPAGRDELSWLPELMPDGWDNAVSWDNRAEIIRLYLRTQLQRSKDDWGGPLPYVVVRLDEALRGDEAADVRGAVAAAADVLLSASSEPDTTRYPIRRSTLVSLGEMRERAAAALAQTTATIGSIEALTAQLRDWAEPDAGRADSPQ